MGRNVRQRLLAMILMAGAAAMAGTGASTKAAAPPAPLANGDSVLTGPGLADFLAVDGENVWITNKGRVELWSRQAKLAEVPMAKPCGGMTVAFGSLWVADCQHRRVNRIDTGMSSMVAVIPTGLTTVTGGELNVVAGAGSVWAPSDDAGVIARIDPATNTVIASIKVDPGTTYLAFGEGALWAVSSTARTVQKINPATGRVVGKAALGKQPAFLAAGEGGGWGQEQGDGTPARIDPRTGKGTGRTQVGADWPYGGIDTGGGKVWLRTTADQVVVVVDPKSMAVLGRYGKGAGSGALRYVGPGLWTSAHDVHTLSWWGTTDKEPRSPSGLMGRAFGPWQQLVRTR